MSKMVRSPWRDIGVINTALGCTIFSFPLVSIGKGGKDVLE